MTEPVDPAPNEHPEPGGPGEDPALDDATVAALRALLRDEPIPDDDLARERRIRAALAAAPAEVPVPRRRGDGGRWLVAAAAVAVLGVGGVMFLSVSGSGGDDEAATTDMGTSDTTAQETAPGTGGSTDAAGAPERMDSDDPGIGTPDADGGVVPVWDLGSFDDLGALLAAADAVAGREPASTEGAAAASRAAGAMPCIDQQRAFGVPVAGVAGLQGRTVVVIGGPGGTRVLLAESCAQWPG